MIPDSSTQDMEEVVGSLVTPEMKSTPGFQGHKFVAASVAMAGKWVGTMTTEAVDASLECKRLHFEKKKAELVKLQALQDLDAEVDRLQRTLQHKEKMNLVEELIQKKLND